MSVGAAFWCLVLLAVLHAHAANTLGPPVTVAMPAGYSNEVLGSAYDAYNDTLYFSTGEQTVLFVPGASKQGLTWPFAHLAGSPTFATAAASAAEVAPLLATFANPRGVVGWPVYAALGLTAPVHHAEHRWTGVLLSDCFNNAIRFINFGRGNNVTTVAGGTQGANDGVGTGAQLRRPFMIAWGVLTVPYPAANGGGFGLYPTAVWCEEYNSCVRSGVPVYNTFPFPLMNTTVALQSMALKTATFAGLCGAGGTAGTGSAYNTAVLNGPIGIALANPFLFRGNPALATLMLVGEWAGQRLSLMTPLWPPEQRYLTALWTTTGPVVGVRAYARPYVSVIGGWEADVELVLALGGLTTYENVTTTLQNISGGIQWKGVGARVLTTLVTTGLRASRESIIIPQVYVQGGVEMYRSVLVVAGGASGATLMQQACCLDAWYAGGLPGSETASATRPESPTGNTKWTASATQTQSPSVRASRSISSTPSSPETNSFSPRTVGSISASWPPSWMSRSSTSSRGTGSATRTTRTPPRPSRTKTLISSTSQSPSPRSPTAVPVRPPPPPRVLSRAVDVAGGTRTLLTGGVAVATYSLLSMQRLNGVLAVTQCKAYEADSRPVSVNNPFQWSIASEAPAAGGARVGVYLSGYRRAEWLILAAATPVTFAVVTVVLLITLPTTASNVDSTTYDARRVESYGNDDDDDDNNSDA